jgi:hypothetical protein
MCGTRASVNGAEAQTGQKRGTNETEASAWRRGKTYSTRTTNISAMIQNDRQTVTGIDRQDEEQKCKNKSVKK